MNIYVVAGPELSRKSPKLCWNSGQDGVGVQVLTDSPSAVELATSAVVGEFAADGVVYLELRTTPRREKGMSKREYLEAVLRGLRGSGGELGIMVRLLVSVDRKRGVEEAEENVCLAESLRASGAVEVVGVDLSGDPSVDATPFLPVLQKAKAWGLGISAHLSELEGTEEETVSVMEKLGPNRIGHGTFLWHRVGVAERAVSIVRARRTHIEICPTSNILTKTVTSYADSHLDYWLREGHPVSVGTDDKGVFQTSLTQELCHVASAFQLSQSQLILLSRNAAQAAFCLPQDKRIILDAIQRFQTNACL